MKFSHLGDCHLGSWRFPELQELNMQSFSRAIDFSIKEEVDMVLISGDLFDSAYPPIEILKKTFKEFKKLSEAKIPCFLIAGSHDYSVSGKSFLDVLEHAGFCKNVYVPEIKDEKIILQPTIYKDYAIYGYPGKKSSLEVPELRNMEIQDSPGFFKILLLHTNLKEAINNLPIDSISINQLPKADYYALSHLHIDFVQKNLAYSGPTFPNNFEELEELSQGQFCLVEVGDFMKITKIPIKLKEVLSADVEINETMTATDKIISELEKYNLEDKIVLLKIRGVLDKGKISEIKFNEIEQFVKSQKAFVFIKNISKLVFEKSEFSLDLKDVHKIEDEIIKSYLDSEESEFNKEVHHLLRALNTEKQEDETNHTYNERLIGELQNILRFE